MIRSADQRNNQGGGKQESFEKMISFDVTKLMTDQETHFQGIMPQGLQ